MSDTNLIKKYLRPFYRRTSKRMFKFLKLDELMDMLLQINHRAFTIEEELQKLKKIQAATNLILSGQDSYQNELYRKYEIAPLEIFDLSTAIAGESKSEIDIINFIDRTGLDFANKTVTIIGGNSDLYAHILQKKGAKKIHRIESNPQISKDIEENNVSFIYPLNLGKASREHCDILLIPSASWTTLLSSRSFAGFGSFVKESIILQSRVNSQTSYSSSLEPAIFDDDGRLSLNDNYLRRQLHLSGFVEVECIYTEGVYIDNYFDLKVTKFNQLNGFTIIKKNRRPTKDQLLKIKDSTEKIYIGRKLPSKKYLS